MTKLDAKRILETIRTMCENSKKLTKQLAALWADNAYIIDLLDEDETKVAEEKCAALVRYTYETLMNSYNRQYNSVCQMGRVRPKLYENKEVNNNLLDESKYIDIAPLEDALYVKLPRVPAKHYRRTGLFVEDIRNKMQKLGFEKKIPTIQNKQIRVLNVFSTSFEERFIPDNDNYDLKSITDVLTDYIRGGDSGLRCSFCYDAVKSDEVTEGTYIIISRAENGFLSATDVLEVLKNVFEKEGEGQT